jgi:hypothetical protein
VSLPALKHLWLDLRRRSLNVEERCEVNSPPPVIVSTFRMVLGKKAGNRPTYVVLSTLAIIKMAASSLFRSSATDSEYVGNHQLSRTSEVVDGSISESSPKHC